MTEHETPASKPPMTSLPPTAKESAEQAEAPDDCEHHWVSKHEPGHILYWVRACQLCHAVDWDQLDSDVRAAVEAAALAVTAGRDAELARTIDYAARLRATDESWSAVAGERDHYRDRALRLEDPHALAKALACFAVAALVLVLAGVVITVAQ